MSLTPRPEEMPEMALDDKPIEARKGLKDWIDTHPNKDSVESLEFVPETLTELPIELSSLRNLKTLDIIGCNVSENSLLNLMESFFKTEHVEIVVFVSMSFYMKHSATIAKIKGSAESSRRKVITIQNPFNKETAIIHLKSLQLGF